MEHIYFIDKFPKSVAFAIQAVCLWLFYFSWVAFGILTPLLYFGSPTTKMILCSIMAI